MIGWLFFDAFKQIEKTQFTTHALKIRAVSLSTVLLAKIDQLASSLKRLASFRLIG